MKNARLLAAVLALGLGVVSLAMASGSPAGPSGAEGKELYEAKCRSCHGTDGSKALLSKPVKGLKPADVERMMAGYQAKTYGGTKKATMENLASAMSAEDIKLVAAYIGTL